MSQNRVMQFVGNDPAEIIVEDGRGMTELEMDLGAVKYFVNSGLPLSDALAIVDLSVAEYRNVDREIAAPTPDQIANRAAKIRNSWTYSEKRRRKMNMVSD